MYYYFHVFAMTKQNEKEMFFNEKKRFDVDLKRERERANLYLKQIIII